MIKWGNNNAPEGATSSATRRFVVLQATRRNLLRVTAGAKDQYKENAKLYVAYESQSQKTMLGFTLPSVARLAVLGGDSCCFGGIEVWRTEAIAYLNTRKQKQKEKRKKVKVVVTDSEKSNDTNS